MGPILDLAVAALAVTVVASLALLAWTLAVSVVRAVHHGRSQVLGWRQTLTDAEARLGSTLGVLDDGIQRANRYVTPGDPPDR